MAIVEHGWRTLAEPTYGIEGVGLAVRLSAGSQVQIVDVVDGLPGTLHAVARNADRADQWDEYSDVMVTASALRFADACGQCNHAKDSHRLYTEDGDPEPWSWCDECGGRCEFVGAAPLALAAAETQDGPYSCGFGGRQGVL